MLKSRQRPWATLGEASRIFNLSFQKTPTLVELKCAYSGAAAERLGFLLSGIFAADPQHQSYTVTSVYFDSLERSLLGNNLDSVPVRRKYRLRYYDSPERAPERLYFEIKERNGSSRRKLRSLVGTAGQPPALASFAESLRDHHLFPALVSRYFRRRFRDPEHPVSVTLDTELAFGDPSPFGGLEIRPEGFLRGDPRFVLEIKGQSLDECLRVSRKIPQFRIERFSKYREGYLLLRRKGQPWT